VVDQHIADPDLVDELGGGDAKTCRLRYPDRFLGQFERVQTRMQTA
jgi:hypothetical protein